GRARRGAGSGRRRGGRPRRDQGGRRRRRGPTNREKAAFVYKHRFLIVKRPENFQGKDWDHLVRMYQYLPELRLLRRFCADVYALFSAEQVARLARRRRTLLLKEAAYREVPELAEALGLLGPEKFDRMVAFLE